MHKLSLLFILFCLASVSIHPPLYGGEQKIVSLSLQTKQPKAQQGETVSVVLRISVSNKWHINSNKPNEDFLIPSVVKIKSAGAKLAGVKYPEAKNIRLAFSDVPVSVFEGEMNAELNIKILPGAQTGKQKLEVILEYQACNDATCNPPAEASAVTEIEITAGKDAAVAKTDTAGTSVKTADENNPAVKAKDENGIVKENKQEESGSVASTLEKSGLLLSLLFVFFAGLALNLTPCVYPLIPITIGYFGGQAEGKTGRLFLLGVLYVLGMSITYSLIGVVTALSGTVFGTLLQNTYVIIGIALVFVALALSQFDVWEFKMPDSWVNSAGGAKGGAYGAFFMGLTMGIVAAPCIGPFVLGLVTYVAAKADPFFGFLMFFVLALGLGFPYLILAVFSGKIKQLPRSGLWMVGVKHIFGFLLIGMAIYFIDPLFPKAYQGYALSVFGIIAALILLFFDKTANQAKGFRAFRTVFSIAVLAVSAYALIPKERLEPEWHKFSTDAYEKSLNRKEPMIIDFYADWCIPCKELDALTFSDRRVIKELSAFNCFKMDMTKSTQENENLRKRFEVKGMPTVIIFDAGGKEARRLTGFVKPDELLQILKPVKK